MGMRRCRPMLQSSPTNPSSQTQTGALPRGVRHVPWRLHALPMPPGHSKISPSNGFDRTVGATVAIVPGVTRAPAVGATRAVAGAGQAEKVAPCWCHPFEIQTAAPVAAKLWNDPAACAASLRG
jgi:hypothetical protein